MCLKHQNTSVRTSDHLFHVTWCVCLQRSRYKVDVCFMFTSLHFFIIFFYYLFLFLTYSFNLDCKTSFQLKLITLSFNILNWSPNTMLWILKRVDCSKMINLSTHNKGLNPFPLTDTFLNICSKNLLKTLKQEIWTISDLLLPQCFQLISISLLSFTESFHILGYKCVF